MRPLVSICIPTYKGETYIAEAIQSVIEQTYPNLEIVVSDDGSKDNTLTIVESFKNQTTIPIKVYHHTPSGIGANWNNCIKYAKGKYIKFLMQDDVLYNECIIKMVSLIESNATIGLVYAKRNFIYDSNNVQVKEFIKAYSNLHYYWCGLKLSEGVLSGKDYLKNQNFLNSPKNKIGEPTSVLLRSEVFNVFKGFSEEMKQTLDCEFWYRIMTKYDIGFIDDYLTSFRLHNKQASVKNKNNNSVETEMLYKSYYNNLLSYIHPKNKWKLLKRYHPFWRRLIALKRHFYGVK